MLSGQVLLLDVSFRPVNLIRRKKALKLVYMEKASEVLPGKVLQLRNYLMRKSHPVKYSKKAIFVRDNYCCQYCGKMLRHSQLTIDHIVPRAKGGKSNFLNCVTACGPCNHSKGHKGVHEFKRLRMIPVHPTHSDLVKFQAPDLWETYQTWISTVCN
jgi:hypothetical protein